MKNLKVILKLKSNEQFNLQGK